MRVTLDRWEGDYALAEAVGGISVLIQKKKLPPDAVEGSTLFYECGSWKVDQSVMKLRKNKVNRLIDDLFITP